MNPFSAAKRVTKVIIGEYPNVTKKIIIAGTTALEGQITVIFLFPGLEATAVIGFISSKSNIAIAITPPIEIIIEAPLIV